MGIASASYTPRVFCQAPCAVHLAATDCGDSGGREGSPLYKNRSGSGTVPWRVVNLIRQYTDKFAVLVRFSAARLIALGANEIVMHNKCKRNQSPNPRDPLYGPDRYVDCTRSEFRVTDNARRVRLWNWTVELREKSQSLRLESGLPQSQSEMYQNLALPRFSSSITPLFPCNRVNLSSMPSSI